MELKSYQKNVINDLTRFLTLLVERQNIADAYAHFWLEKNVMVGLGELPAYHAQISGVPEVCFKVPTGGGKTYIAASSVKPIFNSMPNNRTKAVVWLVPSDAILTQTYQALSDVHHPYRQRLDVDFGSRVEVYSKAQLLNGQNFNPSTVSEQLSVFVLSYDSFRTSKKEGRKAFQENGNLASFTKLMSDRTHLLPNTDDTALIQIIRSFNPVVIVDESHHATSTLSIEMLANFNPCFVLDLTATPKKNSNIISFVSAAQLKQASMVKLPVIVYNRKSLDDVYADAIGIRHRLEKQAIQDRRITGRYIRPIVLFQAQPKNNQDSTTYKKIKDTLLEAGIPEEEIAIKTADIDELKNVDLLSERCSIRYIITVNALKEGWDCPFAYILATVANRTSPVDVEQILGRVLRLPSTVQNPSSILNLSYVITSSSDFHHTLERIVMGLNTAGFSRKDYRAKNFVDVELDSPKKLEQSKSSNEGEGDYEEERCFMEIDVGALKERVSTDVSSELDISLNAEVGELLAEALTQNAAYEEEIVNAQKTSYDVVPSEIHSKLNFFKINDEFKDEVQHMHFPQFVLRTAPSIFSEKEYVTLDLEHLSTGFSLRDKDVQIDFETINEEIAKVDVTDADDAVPKAWMLKGADKNALKGLLNEQPSEKRLLICKGMIEGRISKLNCVNEKELKEYVSRVMDVLTREQLADFEQQPYPYVLKVEKKVKELLAAHRSKMFDLWLEQGKIECRPNYSLKQSISPIEFTSIIPKSLYSSEEDMNGYEQKVVWALSALNNIKWWHRNIARTGFQINGPIHAYPDIIAMTTSGKVLMIETKGDHLDNSESKEKARIGHQWDRLSGGNFKYFMVFQSRNPDYPGAFSYERFMEIIEGI